VPPQTLKDDPITLWGLTFKNRIGMAAGFDKNGEAVAGLARLGFGHIEVGTITPLPQPGNARPRVFRLPEDQAIINRYGFNSAGADAAYRNLSKLPPDVRRSVILGINIGKNKDSQDAAVDYRRGLKRFHDIADYITINISSPNTPNLRDLQRAEPLRRLLSECRETLAGLSPAPPLLLKIAPDLDALALNDVLDQVIATRIDGLIISNTTLARPQALKNPHAKETGGLSGKPLLGPSTDILKQVSENLKDRGVTLPLIGVGGIGSAEDVRAKIGAGACLIQAYTAFALNGFGIMRSW
jgi:dihydroorotate dehydrogenase